MSRSNPQAHHRRHFSFYILHRYLGLPAVIFVVLLAVTGIMLNHSDALHLDEKTVQSKFILDWYGVDVEVPQTGYQAGEYWVSHLKQSVFINDRLLQQALVRLTGAIATDQFLVLSGEEKVLLLTTEAELVDVLDFVSGLPQGGIQRLGVTKTQRVMLETDQGVFVASADLLNWQPAEKTEGEWSEPVRLPAMLKTDITNSWRGDGITFERFILDLHSGRILAGKKGVLLMDLVAVLMIMLSLTGIGLWIVRLRKRSSHLKAFVQHQSR